MNSSDSGKVFIWSLQKGQLLKTLNQHKNYVYTVTISPDGTSLASSHANGMIKIWQLDQ